MKVIAFYTEPVPGAHDYQAGPVHAQNLINETLLKEVVTYEQLVQAVLKDGQMVFEENNLTIVKAYDGQIKVRIAGHTSGEIPINLAMLILKMGDFGMTENIISYLTSRYKVAKIWETPEVIVARAGNINDSPVDVTSELFPH